MLRWVAAQPVNTLYTLSLAIAEIRAGINRVADPVRRSELARWLEQKVRPLFGGRILEADEAFWMTMLEILERAKPRRRTLPVTDLIFAAAAERHGLVVVTRNVKHFDGLGVRVLDPWQAAPVIEVRS